MPAGTCPRTHLHEVGTQSGERKGGLAEDTNGTEIKNGKEKRKKKREAKVEIQLFFRAGGKESAVTQPLLRRC